MTYAIYIAAAAIIGLLIGVVTLSIGYLRKTVLRNIRSKTLGLMSVYDELLEKKSRQLMEAERARQQAEAQAQKKGNLDVTQFAAAQPAPAAYVAPNAAVYRDGAIGSAYHTIRNNFSFDMEKLLLELRRSGRYQPGTATRLLNRLNYDTVYQLSTLQPEEQILVLREALSEQEKPLLDSFIATGKPFQVLAFYDYLRALADAEPNSIKLRVPVDMHRSGTPVDGVEIIPDSQICEGFQIEDNQILYDYCIKARELR